MYVALRTEISADPLTQTPNYFTPEDAILILVTVAIGIRFPLKVTCVSYARTSHPIPGPTTIRNAVNTKNGPSVQKIKTVCLSGKKFKTCAQITKGVVVPIRLTVVEKLRCSRNRLA